MQTNTQTKASAFNVKDLRDLAQVRECIQDVDDQILQLMHQRMKLARLAGLIKKYNQIPVRSLWIESESLRRLHTQARKVGLPQAMVDEVMKILVKYSVMIQDEIKESRVPLESGLGDKRHT